MSAVKEFTDKELKIKGFNALNKALGVSGALRFLSMLHHEPTDYVQISRDLYKNQTLDEVFERAKKNWKG